MRGDIRQCGLPGYELGDYIREAMDFLREHEPPEGYFVGFSGGKDSITLLELCKMAGVKHEACYSCTRIDPPEVVRFIRQHHPDVTWLYPQDSFWHMVVKKTPPLRMQRWCCDYLKKAPADAHPLRHRLMGIRAEESVRRASRPRIDTYRRRTIYKPIFYWPEWAIWEFIEQHALPYPSLYDEGFHRIGCVVCPFILGKSSGQVRQRQQSMQKWPGIWRAFEHSVKRWFNAKRAEGLKAQKQHDTAEEYWQAYLNGFE